jgi:hypothetical protein
MTTPRKLTRRSDPPSDWRELKTAAEAAKDHFAHVFGVCGYDQSLTARILGIPRTTVRDQIARYGLSDKLPLKNPPSISQMLAAWGPAVVANRGPLCEDADAVRAYTLRTKGNEYRLYYYDGTASAGQRISAVEPRVTTSGRNVVIDSDSQEPLVVRVAPVWLLVPHHGPPQVVRCEVSLDALLQLLA